MGGIVAIVVVALFICILCLIGLAKGKKQTQERTETANSSKKQLLEVEFPQKGFTPTSTYYQYGDGTARAEYTMFVDSKSKRIAFACDFKDVKYLNFSDIRSCEIVVMDGTTKTNPNLVTYGATSSATISKLLINITTKNIDNPLLSFDVLHSKETEGEIVIGRGSNVLKDSAQYKKSVEFTSKVKSVIDNIVSA